MQFEAGQAEWFAAQVRIGRERMCQRYLQVRGTTFFFLVAVSIADGQIVSSRSSARSSTGIVFCRASEETVGKIVTAPGVIRIVGDGRRPVPIPREDIEAIQRVVGSGQPAERWPYVHAGQRVGIEWGPLRGVSGIVILVKGRGRLIVSISLLQRSIAVEIDSAWVSVASARVSA